jgi:DUF4097 and DUF4098 domain-containing protein YvlB
MNRLIVTILILQFCFIPACMPEPEQYTELEFNFLEATDAQSILIQVDHGEVVILETENSHLEVGGQVWLPDELEYEVNSGEKQILIKARVNRTGTRNVPLHLEVHVPKDMLVRIETNSASVFASNYQGNLDVTSVSGNITIDQVTGGLTLQSNRGNIAVGDSSGIISMVGNYGALNAQNVHGETAISTIMGNVMFDGLIQTGDVVRLETDHGTVSVNLSQASALSIQVRSTSGDVTCSVPDINSTTRTCDGKIRSADGTLAIRTVSGAVTMKLLP